MTDTARIPSPTQEAAIESIVEATKPTTKRRKRAAQHIIAIDVDLRRIHVWSNKLGKVCYEVADPFEVVKIVDALDPQPDVILIEVAGPIMHREGGRQRMHHTHRWMLWNMMAVTTLVDCFSTTQVLVATSTRWTNGYPEKERHAIAKTTATNHDLREAESMIAFYVLGPQLWVPFDKFLETL